MGTLISGATGLVGQHLSTRVASVRVLTRSPQRARDSLGDVETAAWSAHEPLDPAVFDGIDTVFHLAGEPVAEGRWTHEKRRRILESRELGTRSLVDAMARADHRPGVLVSASAVGLYGDRGDEILDEHAGRGGGFLSDVCEAWEREALRAEELGVRVVTARIGVILARDGGALEKMLAPFRLGLGGTFGHGRQWMPWIHVDDVARLLVFAAETPGLSGPVNVVSPNPATNRQFTRALGAALGRPTIARVPTFAVRAMFGDKSEILLASQRAVPHAALEAGFEFSHPDLDSALADVLGLSTPQERPTTGADAHP